MLRNILFTLVLICVSLLATAQLHPLPTAGWWQASSPLSAGEVLQELRHAYALSEDHSFVHQESKADPLGHTHLVYQQHYHTLPIEGAYVTIHSFQDRLPVVNEHLVTDLAGITQATVTSEQAIQTVLQTHPASRYTWEDPVAEKMLQRATGHTWASHYPVPKLLIKRPVLEGETPVLTYQLEVFSLAPLQKTVYYVNAQTGEVIDQYDALCSSSVEGTAHTRYHGVRSFMTDSLGPEEYRLRDYSRGQGIETYDMNEGGFISQAVDFTDKDNIWDTVNPQQNEVANDVHWGAQQSYDYFLQAHGLDSYDGNGSPIVSYVHFAIDYINAFWSGSWMAYGNADSSRGYYPLTTVDVVAHELTHGVTRASSNLIYRNEHGALNESFSDIFGKAVEWYADSANFSWRIARQALANGRGIRSMANPNSYTDPHTYQGNFWEFGTFDNGGVHINSGVQNKWFQLLVDGGTHTNDNGVTVTVPAIGWEAAEAISYRNNNVYLSRFSVYADARMGSLLAAADLYGPCSPAFQAVALAWDAVGVGEPTAENDLQLVAIDVNAGCSLSDQENISLQVYNNSCATTLPSGTAVNVGIELNGQLVGTETISLLQDLQPNGHDTWPLQQITLDLSSVQTHDIKAWITYFDDTLATNDTLEIERQHRKQQNWDVSVNRIVGPSPQCFMDKEPVRLRIRFHGCDSLAAGTLVPVEISEGGQVAFIDTVTLPNTLFPNQNVDLNTNKMLDFSRFEEYRIEARTLYPTDSFNNNDAADAYVFQVPYTYQPGQRMHFVNFTRPLDSILLSTGFRAEASLSVLAGNGLGLGLQLSGTTVNPRPRYDFPDSLNVWDVNGNSRAQACWCVDAANSATMAFTFDRKQTRAAVHRILAGQDLPYSSPFRVTVNGQQVSPTYLPDTDKDDDWSTHTLILDSLAGQQLEVCVEARALSNRAGDVTGSVGDNTYVDNIFFGVPQLTATPTANSITTVRLYPNPAHTQVRLEADDLLQHVTIDVVDALGRVIWHQQPGSWQRSTISVAQIAAGQYWIRLTHQDGVMVLPIVVQR